MKDAEEDFESLNQLTDCILKNREVLYLCLKKGDTYAVVNNLFEFGYTKKSCYAQGSSKYYLFVIALCF